MFWSGQKQILAQTWPIIQSSWKSRQFATNGFDQIKTTNQFEDIWRFLVSKWGAGSCEQDKDINFQFKSKTMKDSAIKGPLEYAGFSDFYLILHFWKLCHLFQTRRIVNTSLHATTPKRPLPSSPVVSRVFLWWIARALTVTTEGEEFGECISKLQGMWFESCLAPFSVLESLAGLGEDSSASSWWWWPMHN